MVIKIMDGADARSWKRVCELEKQAFELAEKLPKILEDDEDQNENFSDELNRLEVALDGVIKEGLYPAYIPTNAL